MGIIANLSQAAQLSVFKWLSPAQIADVRARTAALDLTTALQAAIDSGEPLFWPAGVYRHDATLVLKPAAHTFWRGAGRLTELRAGAAMGTQVRNPTAAEGFVTGYVVSFADITFNQNGLAFAPVLNDPSVVPSPASQGFRSNPPSTELASAEAWLGRPLDHLISFLDDENSWAGTLEKARTEVAAAAESRRAAEWVVPLTVTGTSLAQVAAGQADVFFRELARVILERSTRSEERIRLGWEMNGGWYPWTAVGKEADYIAAFQRVVRRMRAISPKFKFAWVCNMTLTGIDPSTMYPGDAYVDYVGMNAYLVKRLDIDTDAASTLDLKTLNAVDWKFASTYGFDWLATFAASHNKPICIAEWGTNSDGTQYYVSRMAKYIRDNNVVYHGYWDQNNTWGNVGGTGSDYWDKVTNNQYPGVSAEFSREFGPLVVSTPAAHAAGQDTVTYIPLVANREVAAWYIVGSAPAGISIVGQTLVVATTSLGGVFTVRAVDVRGTTADLAVTVTMQATVSAWTPSAFGSDLDAWIDINDAGTLTVSGGTCSAAADKSGKGHGLSQGTAGAQPAYSATARNAKPGLTFDGSNDVMSFASATTFAGAGASGGIAFAGYVDAAVSSGTKALYGFADSASGHIERCSFISGTLRVGHSNLISTKQAVSGVDIIMINTWPATPSSGGLQNSRTRFNGVLLPVVVSISSTATISEGRIGARPVTTSSTDFAPMVLQEFVKLTREPTPYEAVLLSGYLAWKWGTQGLLRQDSPLKLGAPKLTA